MGNYLLLCLSFTCLRNIICIDNRFRENLGVAAIESTRAARKSRRCVPWEKRAKVTGGRWRTLCGAVSSSRFTGSIFDPSRLDCFVTRNFFLLHPDRKPASRLRGQCGMTNEIKTGGKEHGVSFFTADLTKLGHSVKSICQSSRPVSIRYSGSITTVRSCKSKLISCHLSNETSREGTRNARTLQNSGFVSSGNLYLILHKWISS